MGDETLLERILNRDEEPNDLPLALLQQITNDFSEERKIGQGGFGVVYKGVLRNGIIVAVKRIEVNVITIDDVSFRREINSLMKVNHQNVVRFLGFCSHAYHTSIKEAGSRDINFVNIRERLLCLEYVSNGSLDKHITDELRGLEWETRYDIIVGICNGMCHLKEKNIIHMDLKPPNILLDDHMIPTITDFGLSRPNENSHTMGQRFGTRGYFAPEYEIVGETSFECDIYSLGVIIIEIVTGCKGIPDNDNVLRRWRHRWNKPPTPLQYHQLTRCIEIAVNCRKREPVHRPSISEIISSLGELESMDGHIGQISPHYDEDDMLGIKPLELRVPSELKKISCFAVELTNNTHSCIAFNIQPSSSPLYSAQPAKGIVRPQSSYGVKITVPPQDMHHTDKIVVQSMKVSVGLRDEDITKCMFDDTNKFVDEVKLMVVYEPMKPQENCKSRQDTDILADEVPEAGRRNIVQSTSGKGKLHSGKNAEAASMDINSSVQEQRLKKTEQCNFYPPQSLSHHSLGYLLMPLLGSVAAKACSALVAEMLRACGLSKARRKLECQLGAVQCILLDADAKSRTNSAVRRWMADLKTAAYQTDDILDDFRYEALRRRADKICHRSTTHKVLRYFTANNPVVFRLSMSRKMKDALEMIDELVVEMNNFNFLQHAEAPNVDHPQTHSQVDESDIVGRQDEKEQVVKILLDHCHDNTNNNNVMVLPIVGMGGIGKTTLAQLVHNDQRVMHHFEVVLWACVSDKFIIEEIIRSIIEVATMKKCGLTQMEALQKKLCTILGKKRYLLVLDDVWNEDEQKWDAMRSLLNLHARPGSAIIVTSRSDQVAAIMGTLPPHQISLLSEDQSWKLFHRNTFGRGVEMQEELVSMAKSIVHKCKGLPLAIKTISALLGSKNPNQWFSVMDSDVWKDGILKTTGILPALQLSYDHLSPEEKICFSFCAIFPKDSPMDKDMLIQLWMANDFTVSETSGQQVFDVLVWRCFLQDVNTQKNQFHRPITCKMHDLMHDLADSVSGNDCTILKKPSSHEDNLHVSTYASSLPNEVRHLSLEYVDNNTIATMKELLSPQPRTLLIQRRYDHLLDLTELQSMAKSKFISLRALETSSLKAHVINLKHLRYLDCSHSTMSALPEVTTMLYSLQTLKLIDCKHLEKLPEDMRYMSSLRHIFLIRCGRLKRMPQGIGQLNSLLTLTDYVIDSDVGRGIDQLRDLNLGGGLSLTELRKVHSVENAKEGNISVKHNLKQLSLDWYGPSSRNVPYEVHTNAEGILEALRPHKRLEVLVLSNYTGAKLSSWTHNSTLLEHLSELYLTGCKNCKDLPPLWRLPSLAYLSLKGLNSLTSICVGNDDANIGVSFISPPPFFPKLETMIVSNMPKLERWHQEAAGHGADVLFPRLKTLTIYKCPMLASMPEMLPLLELLQVSGASDIPLYHLANLSVQSNLEYKCVFSVEPIVGWQPVDIHLSRLGDSSVRLNLNGLMENADRFEEELNRAPCRFIKNLQIIDCDCLFSSEPSQVQQSIWNHFGFVEGMWISDTNTLVQWPVVEFGNLNCLRDLHLSGCSNLTGSLPSTISDDENVQLPPLQSLVIVDCDNLVEVPKLPASLEILSISNCPNLVSMATIRNVDELKALSVLECEALTAFPDGDYGVITLRTLEMQQCPRLETLPEGLLQQLPGLEMLWIRDCPNLEVAFSRGGAYWNLVEAIPYRYIGAQDQSHGLKH